MKKIKKSVAVVAALLLMSSGSISANVNENSMDISCFDHASYIVDTLVDAGYYSYAEGSNLFAAIMEGCND